MVRFAHLSDLHLPPLPWPGLRPLAGKRLLGYLSWQRKRKHQHRPEVLEALSRDLQALAPDHICVTGDLTNLGLPAEFEAAAAWLRSLGEPARVSLVPGNHDAYAPDALAALADAWAPWLAGEGEGEGGGDAGFPRLQRRGGLAFIGVSTAVPTGPGRAQGRIGREQLSRLGAMLAGAARRGERCIVLLHHPPQPGAVPLRRALTDAAAFRSLIAEHGAELILHGHAHVPLVAELAGPAGPVPVLGVGAAGLIGRRGGGRGHYRLLRPAPEGGWLVQDRHYVPEDGFFTAGAEWVWPLQDAARDRGRVTAS